MCCGGCSCSLGEAIANILYITERLASCCAAMLVVVCLVGTLITMLAMGVGLGYNYCMVDTKIGVSEPLESENSRRSMSRRMMPGPDATEGTIIDYKDEQDPLFRRRKHANKRSIDTKVEIPSSNIRNKTAIEYKSTEFSKILAQDIEIKPTMVVPVQKYNLHSLIERLKRYKMNVTLELIQ